MRLFIALTVISAASMQAQSGYQLCTPSGTRHCWTFGAPATATLSPARTKMWGKSGALLVGLDTTDLSILPGAVVSADSFVSVSAASNASVMSLAATPSTGGADISVGKTGSGTLLPLRFWRNPNIVGQWDTSNRFLIGLTSTDVSGGLGSVIAGDAFVSATATTNASVGSFAAIASNYVALASAKTGSGTYLPITLWTSATERLRIETGGRMLFGVTTSDVSNTAGSMVISDTYVTVTAASNASLGSFAAVAGNYVALASSKTGSGTYLPLAFFTSGSERFRIDTSGNLVQAGTTRLNSSGAATFSGVTVSTMTGSTQCVQVNSSGVFSGSGAGCGGSASGSTADVQFNTSGAFDTDTGKFSWEKTNHRLVLGLSSSDVSTSAGAVISSNAFVSATATSNASVGSFAAIASNYVALASSRSGSGTYLPLTFWTSSTERMRIDTAGHVKISNGTPSVSGSGCSLASGSNDARGSITGCSTGITMTLTFASAYATAPFCVMTSSIAASQATTTTTTLSSSVGGIGSPTLYYVCIE